MRRILVIICLITFLSPALAMHQDNPPRVLFISSYHPAFPSFAPQVSGLKGVLDENGVELDVEFMDTKRLFDDTNLTNFTNMLRYKLESLPRYDVLVVGDDNALNYAREHQKDLFAGMPIVFLAVNDVHTAMRMVHRHGVTGVLESISLNETLDLMYRILPRLRRVVAVADATPSGQGDLARFKETLKIRNNPDYEILDLSKISWKEFPARLHELSSDDAILLLAAYRDKNGVTITFQEGLHELLNNAPCPVFHLWSHGMGQGILGGKVISFTEQGKRAGQLVMSILEGDEPGLLKVVSGSEANVTLFDWQVMKRFGIDKSRLPQDTVLINEHFLFKPQNRSLLLQTGAVILALIVVITILLRINRKRAAAERLARRNERRYRAYIDNAPEAVIIADFTGTIVQANEAATLLTGYTGGELVGMTIIKTLLPEALRAKASGLLRMLRTKPKVHSSLEIVRKDGSIAYVLFDAAALDDDTFVIFCKDLTELKSTHDAMTKSEELFRGLLEQAGDAIFACDTAGQILFVNQAACDSLGYTHEEIEKLRIWDVDPESVRFIQPDTVWQRQHVAIETRHYRKDGISFPVEVKMGTILVGGESIILALVRDITVRKERERRIRRESEINLAQAEIVRALTAPDATLQRVAEVVYQWSKRVTGATYAYVGSVEGTERHLHVYNVTAMLEDGCRMSKQNMIFPIHKGKYPSLWGHSLNTGSGFFTNEPLQHPSSKGLPEGHVTVEQFLSVPCRYEGELVGQIGLANPGRNFTDEDLRATEVLASLFALAVYRKRAESELIRAKDAAEAASRSKSEFLANVSHELRTPINGMFTMLKLAQETGLNKEQAEYVETAITSGRNLLQVVNDVLDLSRIEAGKMELAESLFFSRELMDSVASIFRLQAKDKGIKLSFNVSDKVDESYVGDQGRIRQILFNLVGNALKFTEAGSITVTCDRGKSRRKGYTQLILQVSDTGIGIPEEKLDTIFDSFEQVDGSYSRRFQGTGLGLHIVKRFAKLMHGDVTVESTLGVGSVFTAEVRVHNIQGHIKKAEQETAEEQPRSAPKRTNSIRLLLAEDDRINRMAASRLLAKRGYEVESVENGREAVEALEKNDYDCILMDIQMPGMDGLEATRAIRALPEDNPKRSIPIIALTAHAMTGDREKFLRAGLTDYLSKPMDIEALENLLYRIVPDA